MAPGSMFDGSPKEKRKKRIDAVSQRRGKPATDQDKEEAEKKNSDARTRRVPVAEKEVSYITRTGGEGKKKSATWLLNKLEVHNEEKGGGAILLGKREPESYQALHQKEEELSAGCEPRGPS